MLEALVLDTAALPVWRGLDGPLWLSVRKLCELSGTEMIIPELVVQESVNKRAENYAQVATRFVDAFSELEKFFDIDPIYVPDEAEIRETWEAELRETFTVVPVHGDDAVEALRREAVRVRPARLGKGGRDSAVWLTVLRLASTRNDVAFVSNNILDFGVRKSTELHPDLLSEAHSASGEIHYFTSIHALIDSLASKIDPPEVSAELLGPVLGYELRQTVLARAAEDDRYPEISATELISESLAVSRVNVKSAYTIAERNLVLIIGQGQLPVGDPGDGHTLDFTFGAWLDFDPADGTIVAGEVQSLSLADPT